MVTVNMLYFIRDQADAFRPYGVGADLPMAGRVAQQARARPMAHTSRGARLFKRALARGIGSPAQ